ncbi:L-threonylcarbamoyladenylate synthase [Pseudodesulfovibrio tunisiensis]|uniref:L-threonylcarbamoyladenylate synthase n=1 Tax=Pseudodesulfovibrio tunisiensis TaxID=463192 RepID=UPI001FB3FFEF|nr:L-threonylcarbamoyladenylate synthase [Pseudodesulfovibrio tunisiensis]
MHEILKALNAGEAVIYPTETLYAIGCDAYNVEAANKVAEIKGRSKSKPLPLIIGGLDMLRLVTDHAPEEMVSLARAFWPGPLSILVKARPELPDIVSDADGYTSVRWSGHPFASELSRRLKRPVVATSANLSGNPPAAVPEAIDPELLAMCGAAYLDPPWPRGGKASSVVRVLGPTSLKLLREGAVSLKKLCDKGFAVTFS